MYLREDTEYEFVINLNMNRVCMVHIHKNGTNIWSRKANLITRLNTDDTRYKLAIAIPVKDVKFTLIDFCVERL